MCLPLKPRSRVKKDLGVRTSEVQGVRRKKCVHGSMLFGFFTIMKLKL
jgi:hypothetical protein